MNDPADTNAHCSPWDPLCRSTIHYPLHIQPLWSFTRPSAVPGDPTPDHTCVLCHDTANAANAGQLDLTASTSSVDPTVETSYRDLLFAHDAQTLNMGVLQTVVAAPPLVAGSAAASVATFLRMFDGTYHDPTLDHTGFLTQAELRLITEWLDIGAQYYNDPFVAPAAN